MNLTVTIEYTKQFTTTVSIDPEEFRQWTGMPVSMAGSHLLREFLESAQGLDVRELAVSRKAGPSLPGLKDVRLVDATL